MTDATSPTAVLDAQPKLRRAKLVRATEIRTTM